jgi:hypothetical protein
MQIAEKPRPDETTLIGNWVKVDDKVVGDATCARIHDLTEEYLETVGFSESGAWETLYRDPEDGRYWERVYPQGDWHGGGPPALINLSDEEAKTRYPNLF